MLPISLPKQIKQQKLPHFCFRESQASDNYFSKLFKPPSPLVCRVMCHGYCQNTDHTFDSHGADFFTDHRAESSKGMASGCQYRGDKGYRANKICPAPSEAAARLDLPAVPEERRREEDLFYSSPLLDGDLENISFRNIPYGGLHAVFYRGDPKGTARTWQKMCSAIITSTCAPIIILRQRELEVIKSRVSVVSFL